MAAPVDLIVLSRDLSPLRPDVQAGIDAQAGPGLEIRPHRIAGPALPGDANRWATIARARNQSKSLGHAPWVLLLDDDIVLAPGCVAKLLAGLEQKPGFAALAADCLGDVNQEAGDWDYPRHVGMGVILFRRELLRLVSFRWEPGKCECLCCCEDLRRAGFGIGYMPGAVAYHRPAKQPVTQAQTACPPAAERPRATPGASRVLTAFNRRHLKWFRQRFLTSLRASGNANIVCAVTYGLTPTERQRLAVLPGVEVVALPDPGIYTPILRLHDFQTVVARLPEDTPVAYWDAADTLFQGSLAPLWELVQTHHDRLLVVAEPKGPSGVHQAQSIIDPEAREFAIELLKRSRPYNGGFAAGTARVMLRYLRTAHQMRHSRPLMGTTGGDQIAMNLYLHTHTDHYHEIPDAWNYCLHKRPPGEFWLSERGRFECQSKMPIVAVHGNARTLGHAVLCLLEAT